MAGRPGRSGRRRQDHSSPLVDLDLVFADDRLIDRIADSPWGPAERRSSAGAHRRADGGQPARSDLATADPLAELFVTWRDELAADPMPALPQLGPTLVPEPVPKPAQRRSLRPALSIAAAIAALLVGTATIGSKNADPESALWGITQVVWPARVQSVASAQKVAEQIEVARTAIHDGRSRDAQIALIAATVELGKIDPVDGQDDMTRQVRELLVTASDQAAATQESSTSAPSTADLSSLLGSTSAPSTLAPVPLVPAITASDPALADLAGDTVGAPSPAQGPALPPALGASPLTGIVIPSDSAPSSEEPAPPSSEPAPVTDAPPSSDVPPSDETTSVPPPEPVESTAPVSPPASPDQSAPEQSAPAPTPLIQSPDPTVDPGTPPAADTELSIDPTLATGP